MGLFSFFSAAKPARAQPWLPCTVEETVGSIAEWNQADPQRAHLLKMLDKACSATTVAQARVEVQSIMELGHNLWAYAYMRMLYSKNQDVYYGLLMEAAETLLPVVYTPT